MGIKSTSKQIHVEFSDGCKVRIANGKFFLSRDNTNSKSWPIIRRDWFRTQLTAYYKLCSEIGAEAVMNKAGIISNGSYTPFTDQGTDNGKIVLLACELFETGVKIPPYKKAN